MKCNHLLPETDPDRYLITDEENYCVLLAEPCPFDSEDLARKDCRFFDNPTNEEIEAWYQGVLERRKHREGSN